MGTLFASWGKLTTTLVGVLVVLASWVGTYVRADSGATVLISEIMWDGVEYVELANTTHEAIPLHGWSLTRQSGDSEAKTIIQFSDTDTISAQGYYLLEKTEAATSISAHKVVAGLSLLNTGELLELKNNDGVSVDHANWLGTWYAGSNTDTGVAMERSGQLGDGTDREAWHTSTGHAGDRDGTPGMVNSQPPVNVAPTAVMTAPSTAQVNVLISVSGEDSSDLETEALTYTWNWGDGSSGTNSSSATHSYAKAGTYVVELTVSDGALSSTATQSIVVSAPTYTQSARINELLPDPHGSDTTTEFIELFNWHDERLDLSGWQLDDGEGGSPPYTLPTGTVLTSGEYMVLMRGTTKLALNNTGDSVRLLDPTGKAQSAVTYGDDLNEGQTYNYVRDGVYDVSTSATPGAANVITQPAENEEDEAVSAPTSTTSRGRVAGARTQESALAIVLADIRDIDAGEYITTTGVISAPPGVLGKSVLYVAGSGVQVYLKSGQWPELKLGDRVTVTGTTATYQEEVRLKLSAASDIKKDASEAVPMPHTLETGAIDEAWEGSLVQISGKVIETSGDTFYVDDGSGEVKVAIKETTHIKKPKMKQGIVVTITGIVSRTTSGYRILPRFQEDVRLGTVAGLTSFPATGSGVLWWFLWQWQGWR